MLGASTTVLGVGAVSKNNPVQALHSSVPPAHVLSSVCRLVVMRSRTKVHLYSACVCQDVEGKLEAELASGLDACVDEVTELIVPLGEATAAAVTRLQDAEARRAQLAEELEALEKRAAAVE